LPVLLVWDKPQEMPVNLLLVKNMVEVLFFYVTPNGKHGLIAETYDIPVPCWWFDAQDFISAEVNHSLGGGRNFTDWRLPTKHELNTLYFKKNAVGGFANKFYWSSTEIGDNACVQDFNSGNQSIMSKKSLTYVRAIRSF
jgi:hypothetical protein